MINLDRYYMYFKYYLDCLIDLYYGGCFGGTRKTRYSHLGAHDTSSSFYFVLSGLFRKYPVKDSDVLVDVGCGRGRVITWWLRKGYKNRIISVELDEVIATETGTTFRKHENVEIRCGNIVDCIPDAFKGDPYWAICTNYEAAKNDPEWPVKDLDFGISNGVAIIKASEITEIITQSR